MFHKTHLSYYKLTSFYILCFKKYTQISSKTPIYLFINYILIKVEETERDGPYMRFFRRLAWTV